MIYKYLIKYNSRLTHVVLLLASARKPRNRFCAARITHLLAYCPFNLSFQTSRIMDSVRSDSELRHNVSSIGSNKKRKSARP